MNDNKSKTRLSWPQLVAFHQKLMRVSDEEETWIDALDAKWKKDEAEEAKAAEQNEDSAAAPEPEEAEHNEEASLTFAPQPAPVLHAELSTRGRWRIKKTFGDDFARFDDDI